MSSATQELIASIFPAQGATPVDPQLIACIGEWIDARDVCWTRSAVEKTKQEFA